MLLRYLIQTELPALLPGPVSAGGAAARRRLRTPNAEARAAFFVAFNILICPRLAHQCDVSIYAGLEVLTLFSYLRGWPCLGILTPAQ